MSEFRFLHAADIHLDSPLRGLERYPDAPVDEVRLAPRRALENLVSLALEEAVAFVLIAGDLYDGDWRDYNTGAFFVSQMRRLERGGIPVHLVGGNHDAASQITKVLSLPGNVVLHSSRRCETTLLPELGVAIHGQSFRNRSTPDDLSAGYPMGEPGRFDIGLLHTSLDGRPGHDDYAPCSVEGLRSKGYDYWALGHVHRREVVEEDPWIVFPGNLQGRHARETGAKGCSLVHVVGGEVSRVEHHVLDVVRWVVVEVDLAAIDSAEACVDRVRDALVRAAEEAGDRLLAARLVLLGATGAHDALVQSRERWLQEFRGQASTVAGAGVWLERVLWKTQRAGDEARVAPDAALDEMGEREDALADLIRMIAGLAEAPPELEGLGEAFLDLKKKLPPELLRGEDAFDPTSPECLAEMLPAVQDLLLGQLLRPSGGEAAES